MTVWDHTRDEPFPDRVVDRLFDLDLIARGDDIGPSSARLVLTELGKRHAFRLRWGRETRAKGGPRVIIAECGTPAAYRRHLRNNEPIDDLCRDAWNEAQEAGRNVR